MPEVDIVLHNGTILTLDASSTVARAVAIRAGRIAGVGAGPDLLRDAGPQTRVIDLEGRIVVPGFFDGHPHMDREGLKARGGVPVAGLRTVADLVDAVARAVKAAAPGEWVVLMPMGEPPDQYAHRPDQLAEHRFPTRHDLDAVSPANPVYMVRHQLA